VKGGGQIFMPAHVAERDTWSAPGSPSVSFASGRLCRMLRKRKEAGGEAGHGARIL